MFEYTKRGSHPGVTNCRRKELCAKKLNVTGLREVAVAKIERDRMDGIGVDDDETIVEGSSGIDTPLSQWMSKLNPKAQLLERCIGEVGAIPFLVQWISCLSKTRQGYKEQYTPSSDEVASPDETVPYIRRRTNGCLGSHNSGRLV